MPIIGETPASEMIEQYLRVYASNIMEDTQPNVIDGLKKVHRRAFTALEKVGVIKATIAVGAVKALHDHGDTGIYDAITRMGQPWVVDPPLINFVGNVGSYSGDNQAASRYPDLGLSDFGREVFLKNINQNALSMVQREDFSGYEPAYLIPALPMALVFPNTTIGYGIGSLSVPLSISNVADLVAIYAEHVKKYGFNKEWDYTPYVEKFLPATVIANTLINSEELLAAYRAGQFDAAVELAGEVDISPERIIFKTVPYGVPMTSIVSLFQEEDVLRGKYPDIFKQFEALRSVSSDDVKEGRFIITPKKTADVTELAQWLYQVSPIVGKVHPRWNYVVGTDEKKVAVIYPPAILMLWYKARRNALLQSKRQEIVNLEFRRYEYETLLIVNDHVDRVIAIIKSNDLVGAWDKLMKEFGLTSHQAKLLTDLRLDSLTKTGKAELIAKRDEVVAKILSVQDSFAKVDDEIVATAYGLIKRFSPETRSVIPNYIGYVKVNKIAIQFQDEQEAFRIINDYINHSKYKLEIHRYDSTSTGSVVLRSGKTGQASPTLPKQKYVFDNFEILGIVSGNLKHSTWLVDGVMAHARGIHPSPGGGSLFYTKPQIFTIDTFGNIARNRSTEQLPGKRKTLSTGAKTDLIFVGSERKRTQYLFHFTPEDPNNVTIYRMDNRLQNITTFVGRQPTIFCSPHRYHVFLNIPQDCLNRLPASILYIRDLEETLGSQNKLVVKLNRLPDTMKKW